MPKHNFRCSRCKETKPIQKEGGTGYAVLGGSGKKICYACVAELDKLDMERTGTALLYLVTGPIVNGVPPAYELTNWPGTLRFPVLSSKRGRHNIAGSRTDVWFKDHAGARWHGVQLGNFSQITRCRRLAVDRRCPHCRRNLDDIG